METVIGVVAVIVVLAIVAAAAFAAGKRLGVKNGTDIGTLMMLIEQRLGDSKASAAADQAELRFQLEQLSSTTKSVTDEAAKLNQMFNNSQARGAWGEIQLRRIVELAGLKEHVDFDTQVILDTDQRPDMLVYLPTGPAIVIDSKVPLAAYMKAQDGSLSEADRGEAMRRHARAVKDHAAQLARREYWKQIDGGVSEFTVMYMPIDNVLADALLVDPDLLEFCAKNRIVLATSTSLMAVLFSVAAVWKQEKLTKNGEEIAKLGVLLYERLMKSYETVETLGRSIRRLEQEHNSVAWQLQRRTLVAARMLKELTGTNQPLKELSVVTPEDIDAVDFPE